MMLLNKNQLKKHVKTWQKDQEIAKSVQDKAMEAAKAVGDAKRS